MTIKARPSVGQRQRTVKQQQKQEESVVNLFKSPEDRPARSRQTCEDYLRNQSVYARNFTQPTIRNTINDFSKLVADNNDEMSNIRLINPNKKNEAERFDKTNCNRLQRFSFKNKLYDYKEVVRVEKLENTEGYGHYKDMGINNFNNIYVKNEFGIEQVVAVLAFKK